MSEEVCVCVYLVLISAYGDCVNSLQTHILPREMMFKSTFLVAMKLMEKLPVWLVDWLLLAYAYSALGNTAKFGIHRPSEGPMVLKEKHGKTPILDVGTLKLIKSGQVKVRDCNWEGLE